MPASPVFSFSTADLCDAHSHDGSGAFRVLPPVFRDFGAVHRFCGPVQVVRALEDNTMVRETLGTPGHGRVLVVAGGGSLRRALVGGNLAQLAVGNDWAGIVIDGCVRDVLELCAAGIPVRALALMPMPPFKRGEGRVGEAAQVQGVWVRPGDWLYADEDGVVLADRQL